MAKLISPELRVALYYRFRFLWPLLAMRGVGLALRVTGWLAFFLFLLFVMIVLGLRYFVMPQVDRYQSQIEQVAGETLGQQVRIGRLQARWHGLNPVLLLDDVHLLDTQGATVLRMASVQAELSWQSVIRWRPIFALLALDQPVLNIRRNAGGEVFVAGISTAGAGDPMLLQTVLAQPRIQILNATLVWEDELRQAPPLVLEDLQLQLEYRHGQHFFGFTGVPPAELAAPLDVRGRWSGPLLAAAENWEGELYTELGYADLAAWKAWVDYPVDLPQGKGGVRLWLARDHGKWQATADLVLNAVRVRLAQHLPELDLKRLNGRIKLEQSQGFLRLITRQLSLETQTGDLLAPLDLFLEWRGVFGQPGQGKFSANHFDLQVLANLAAHLPLDPAVLKLLARHQPQGQFQDVQASWQAGEGGMGKYSLKAGFSRLGLRAEGVVPGAEGLAGRVEASERGGALQIASAASSLDLPAVFAESKIPLDRLVGRLTWQNQQDGVALDLERIEFSGPYAAGHLQGKYFKGPEGPGVIDLKGELSRAEATEAWRFIPRAVSADVPHWLRHSLRGGTGTDAKLTLKGDLRHFPFRDPATGQFLITARARNVTVDYANGWPAIDRVEAEMRFGIGMRLEVGSAHLLGAKLGPVKVEIPDFDVMDERLLIEGQARGPTAAFLNFITRSPVAESIDHFSDDMQARGEGRLDLKLDIPLRRPEKTRIRGLYHFESNQIVFMPGLPRVSAVSGRLEFTENSVTVPQLGGVFLGSPMRMTAVSEKGGVRIRANGAFSVKELRQFLLPNEPVTGRGADPLAGGARVAGTPLDRLAGGSTWQADINVRKRDAEVIVTSDLQGLSSTLPAPLAKPAELAMPLRFHRSALEGRRSGERLRLTLGKLLAAELVRVPGAEGLVLQQGSIGIGQPPRLPERGLSLLVTQPRLDLDRWKKLLDEWSPEAGKQSAAKGSSGTLPLSMVALQAGELTLFGHGFNEIGLRLYPEKEHWRIVLAAKEAAGELFWNSSGKGMLVADLKRLRLEPPPSSGPLPATGQTQQLPAGEAFLGSLPGMDIRVGDFSVGTRRFGRLTLKAENEAGYWSLNQVVLENPDGKLSGRGSWDMFKTRRTRLDFELEAGDTGGLLARLGYPDMIRGGKASLQGKLEWPGSPLAFDAAYLGGSLALQASKGQFAKLNPGAGKLLGLLSLQSLGRRLTLDFRDVVSEGFAYDTIAANLSIRQGVMHTDEPLKVKGPAGTVLMTGQVDMENETQDLLVTVQPEIGGVAAVGAAVAINPVVGAAALVAQNLFENPLNKIFSVQYKVTGRWDAPEVNKLGSSTPTSTSPQQDTSP